jgi:hypothetical protein
MATKILEKNLGGGFRHVVYRVLYSELIAAAASANVDLKALPTGAELVAAWWDLVTVFTSASVTGLTCEVGTSSDTDAFVTAGELLNGPPTAGRRHVKGAWITGDGKTVLARFTAAGANLGNGTVTNLTAGKVDVHFVYFVAKDA